MDIEIKQKFRKVLIIGVAVSTGLILFFSIWHYFHTGKIIITSDNKGATLFLERVSENGTHDEKIAEESGGELSVKVAAGTYRANAGSGRLQSVNTTIKLKGRKTARYHLNPVEPQDLEPVAPLSAESIHASDTEILYLDSEGALNRLSNNKADEVISNLQFRKIEWGSGGFGIGQDLTGGFYSIKNSEILKLAAPPGSGEKNSNNFSIAQNNQAYMSVGRDIYLRSTEGTYKKIYSTDLQSPQLSASADKLAVFKPPPLGEGEDGEKAAQPMVEIINKDGKLIAQKSISALTLSWSPDAQKLIAINQDGNSEIYNTTLESVANLPSKSIQSVSWLDSDTILYGTDSLLWSYKFKDNIASIISAQPAGNAISEISIDESRSYAYIQVASEEKSNLFRLGLKNQKVRKDVLQLGALLPETYGGCYIKYINFTEPTILISPGLEASAATCLAAAKEEVGLFNLSPENFKYSFYSM